MTTKIFSSPSLSRVKLENLDLSVRTYNALKGYNKYNFDTGQFEPSPIDTLAELLFVWFTDKYWLKRQRGIGPKALKEIETIADKFDIEIYTTCRIRKKGE